MFANLRRHELWHGRHCSPAEAHQATSSWLMQAAMRANPVGASAAAGALKPAGSIQHCLWRHNIAVQKRKRRRCSMHPTPHPTDPGCQLQHVECGRGWSACATSIMPTCAAQLCRPDDASSSLCLNPPVYPWPHASSWSAAAWPDLATSYLAHAEAWHMRQIQPVDII